jgi:hypothetical protein
MWLYSGAFGTKYTGNVIFTFVEVGVKLVTVQSGSCNGSKNIVHRMGHLSPVLSSLSTSTGVKTKHLGIMSHVISENLS